MKPWLDTFRKKLAVRGRQGMKVTVIVTVYRGTVWVSIDPPFAPDAILASIFHDGRSVIFAGFW